MGELEKIEEKLKKEIEKNDLPRSEVKVDSTSVLDILWHNALANGEKPVEYSSTEHKYIVSFGYAEMQMPDGKVGVLTDVPDMDERKDVIDMTFSVIGIKDTKETELEFFKNNITVTPEREYKHILDFEWAVIKKGNM
ncbi:MAG: hypothetical protein QW597_07220 [Thermoplasmataceae archaeon]